MIITRTPVRISFLGGGTDYRDSVVNWGGLVVGTTINKYSFITCRQLPAFFDYKTRLTYSKIETVKTNEEIQHRVIAQCFKYLGIKNEGIELAHMADLPGSSGTGSSSSFIVGILHALTTLRGETWNDYELYKSATVIQEQLGETVGYQDQAWAAYGGLNAIEFDHYGSIKIRKFTGPATALYFFNQCTLLFYTNIPRIASEVASTYVPSLHTKEYEHKQLIKLAKQGIEAIENGRYLDLGPLMHESWDIKKSMSPSVTNDKIDKMFSAAMLEGAKGGKLMGAGGGGCFVFMVPPGNIIRVKEAMEYHGAVHIPFKFEPRGSHILLGDRNGY